MTVFDSHLDSLSPSPVTKFLQGQVVKCPHHRFQVVQLMKICWIAHMTFELEVDIE